MIKGEAKTLGKARNCEQKAGGKQKRDLIFYFSNGCLAIIFIIQQIHKPEHWGQLIQANHGQQKRKFRYLFYFTHTFFLQQIQIQSFKYYVMNHRLVIDTEQREKDHQFHSAQEDSSDQEEDQEQDIQSEHEKENDNEEDGTEKSECLIDNSPSQEFQRMETFGNYKKHLNHKEFLESLTKNGKFPHLINQPKLSYLLPQTPIEVNDQPSEPSPQNKASSLPQHQSSVDYEINRIISKVMARQKNTKIDRNSYKKEIEKVNKIDRVNKELLSENAQLIEQINELQKKMNNLYNRLNKRKKGSDSSVYSSRKNQSLAQTLKKYRQKLNKVLDLNSKLQTSLQSQKSKSSLISNTQRSVLSRIQGIEASSMECISSIRNNSLREERKQSKRRGLICQKCCRELKKESSFDESSKQVLFSPVLQVKQYIINSKKKSKQISDFDPKPQKIFTSTACQVTLINQQQEDQLLSLEREEKSLQSIIERNNAIIQTCQKSLYKMVELD